MAFTYHTLPSAVYEMEAVEKALRKNVAELAALRREAEARPGDVRAARRAETQAEFVKVLERRRAVIQGELEKAKENAHG